MESNDQQILKTENPESDEVREKLLGIFSNRNDKAMEELLSLAKKYAQIMGPNLEADIQRINTAYKQDNKAVFMDAMLTLIQQINDFKYRHPAVVDKIKKEEIMDRSENIRLSDLIYCVIENPDTLSLHVAPKADMETKEVFKDFLVGMKKLAKYVSDHENIKEIEATSWIVAKHTYLFKKAGFIIDREIGEAEKEKRFGFENRPVFCAYIKREELLARYL